MTLTSWQYAETSASFKSRVPARKTDIRFMLQLMLLAFCPSAAQSAECRSKDPSSAKTNHHRLFRCPSSLLQRGPTWVRLVLRCLPHQSSMMACLRLTSCPSLHLFAGTRTSNANTEGNGSSDPSNSFLAFQQQRFSIQVLFVCGFV